MSKTIAQVLQQFLDRTYPARTTNLHADSDGRLWSYGWYEIARWVRQCRLHKDNCPDLALGQHSCPAARTRLIVRNTGYRWNRWYSRTTNRHASAIQRHPDAQLAQEVTPRFEGSLRL